MANPSDKGLPQQDADLGGDYARDTHRGAFGDDYAREGSINPEPDPELDLEHDHGLGKTSQKP